MVVSMGSFREEGGEVQHREEGGGVGRRVEGEVALLQKVVVVADCRQGEGGVEVLLSCSYAVPSTAPQTGGAGIRLEHSHRPAPVYHHWPR